MQEFKPSKEHSIAKEAIMGAGKIALKWFQNDPKSWTKDDGTQVSEADIEINDYLSEKINKKLKKIGWLSEENHDDYSRLEFSKVFLIDPIDGTKSFLEGKEDFSISIALIEKGRPISALILNPVYNELFEAELNKGSWMNSIRIRVSNNKNLEGSRMCAFKPMFSHPAWKEPWPKMVIKNKNSIAYRMALVAMGKFDVMMALNPKNDWDIAAGDLLVTEAGGEVTNHLGEKITYNKKEIQKKSVVGGCKDIHLKIIERVKDLPL